MLQGFALAGPRAVLLERDADLLNGASKDGHRQYRAIHGRLNLPLLPAGAIVVAWTKEEQARLPHILAQAYANGVSDARMLSRAEVPAREPKLSPDLQAGILVPGESRLPTPPTGSAHCRMVRPCSLMSSINRLRCTAMPAEHPAA